MRLDHDPVTNAKGCEARIRASGGSLDLVRIRQNLENPESFRYRARSRISDISEEAAEMIMKKKSSRSSTELMWIGT